MKILKGGQKNESIIDRITRFVAILRYGMAVLSWIVDSLGNFPPVPQGLFREKKSESPEKVDIPTNEK